MTQQHRQTIRGVDYAVIPLDPLRGGRLAARVGQILAASLADQGAVAELVKAYKASQAPAEDDAEAAPAPAVASMLEEPKLLAALAGGVAKLNVDELYTVALAFTQGQLFAGQRKIADDHAFNAHFTEHPDHLLLVLAWVLRVNCVGFFGLAGRA